MDDDERRLIRRAEILANREWNRGRNELAREAERRGKRARSGQRLITDYMFPDRNVWSDADASKRAKIQRTRNMMLGWELLEKDKEKKKKKTPTEAEIARAKRVEDRRRERIARAAELRRQDPIRPMTPEDEQLGANAGAGGDEPTTLLQGEEEPTQYLNPSQYKMLLEKARRTGRYD